ncbi:ammonium transporter AmtB-like domain-containing protein [Delphinella strobiligena]|nr:ammonium transporter AmtB-like domain-containing protein [Delphinella strobiligena]
MAAAVVAAWEQCDKVDTAFVFACCAFCWPIVPAVGLAYSGYSTRRNGLASFYPSILAMGVCTLQWWAIGYSIAFGEGNGFFGGLEYAFHNDVLSEPVGTVPAILFSFFQLLFQATVCAIAVGGACERGRLLPLIPFIFLWGTFIYCPLAHTVWSENGYLASIGVLDFAGGTPVHVCSGATATAMSVYLSNPIARSRRSKVRTPSHLALHRPHNTVQQVISLIIIWGSWLAFDAGTTMSLNFKSIMALYVTNICAASGAMTWACISYLETGKWSFDSVFLGAISGLVMITPSAGFIGITTAFFFGVFGALVFRQSLRIKFTDLARRLRWVDNGDTFATHCIGGFCGTLMTGLFASKVVTAYDGSTEIAGGVFFDGNVRQLGIQLFEAVLGFTWTFVLSYFFYTLIDCVPGFEVLAEDSEILAGMDATQMEESFSGAHFDDELDYKPFHKAAPIALD